MKSFETWTLDELELSFGLKEVDNSEILNQWLAAEINIDKEKEKFLLFYKEKILSNNKGWNEDELKLNFIGPFLMLIDFSTKHYRTFSQRTLKTKINNIEVSGKVDFMVALGKQKPRNPYFFLHEYKPARRTTNDPDGQLLIAMLTAQTLNNNGKPMYGVVVEGKLWNFVVLDKNEYTISQSYDATKDDIYKIYAILCKVKEYINEMTKNEE